MRNEYIIYKGRKIYYGDGLYISTTQAFFRGGGKNISRCIKASCHDAAVCVRYYEKKDTGA